MTDSGQTAKVRQLYPRVEVTSSPSDHSMHPATMLQKQLSWNAMGSPGTIHRNSTAYTIPATRPKSGYFISNKPRLKPRNGQSHGKAASTLCCFLYVACLLEVFHQTSLIILSTGRSVCRRGLRVRDRESRKLAA